MKATQAAPSQDSASAAVLYMAAELSAKEWKLAFGGPTGERVVSVAAWGQDRVAQEIAKAKGKLGLPATVRTLAVQEAGRDGFSVHRFFESLGVESLVADPASIETPRRLRRAKTDRLDALRLLALLRRWAGGERTALRVARVPTPAEEDARQPHRERERLVRERTRLTNRLRSMLAAQGVTVRRLRSDLAERLAQLCGWDGQPLPAHWQAAVRRECVVLATVERELADLTAAMSTPAAAPTRQSEAARRLRQLKGVGPQTAHTLGHEYFWRRFRNRREVGAAAGLTGTPYNSGAGAREQGISKAGNARVRRVMVEAAWRWLQWQGESALARWFHERFGGNRRARRIGIVALARRLLIAFWRWTEDGELPAGAVLLAA
jgi:transposase